MTTNTESQDNRQQTTQRDNRTRNAGDFPRVPDKAKPESFGYMTNMGFVDGQGTADEIAEWQKMCSEFMERKSNHEYQHGRKES